MDESSGRAATLLQLVLHDNFLSYHSLNEQSSLSLQIRLPTCMTRHVAAIPSMGYRHGLIVLSQMEGAVSSTCSEFYPKS
jgi:hypothetical protein